jgi:hypothetical protein
MSNTGTIVISTGEITFVAKKYSIVFVIGRIIASKRVDIAIPESKSRTLCMPR